MGQSRLEVDVEDSNLGLNGSPTKIAKASDKVRKGAGEKVTLDPTESVEYIIEQVKRKTCYLTGRGVRTNEFRRI